MVVVIFFKSADLLLNESEDRFELDSVFFPGVPRIGPRAPYILKVSAVKTCKKIHTSKVLVCMYYV